MLLKLIEKKDDFFITEIDGVNKYLFFQGRTQDFQVGQVHHLNFYPWNYQWFKRSWSDTMIAAISLDIDDIFWEQYYSRIEREEQEREERRLQEEYDAQEEKRINTLMAELEKYNKQKREESERIEKERIQELKNNYFLRRDRDFDEKMILDESCMSGENLLFHLTTKKNASSIINSKFIYGKNDLKKFILNYELPEHVFETTKGHYENIKDEDKFREYHNQVDNKVRFAGRGNNTFKHWFAPNKIHSLEFVDESFIFYIHSQMNQSWSEERFDSPFQVKYTEGIILIWSGDKTLLPEIWNLQKKVNIRIMLVKKADFIEYICFQTDDIKYNYIKEPYEVKLYKWPNF